MSSIITPSREKKRRGDGRRPTRRLHQSTLRDMKLHCLGRTSAQIIIVKVTSTSTAELIIIITIPDGSFPRPTTSTFSGRQDTRPRLRGETQSTCTSTRRRMLVSSTGTCTGSARGRGFKRRVTEDLSVELRGFRLGTGKRGVIVF